MRADQYFTSFMWLLFTFFLFVCHGLDNVILVSTLTLTYFQTRFDSSRPEALKHLFLSRRCCQDWRLWSGYWRQPTSRTGGSRFFWRSDRFQVQAFFYKVFYRQCNSNIIYLIKQDKAIWYERLNWPTLLYIRSISFNMHSFVYI